MIYRSLAVVVVLLALAAPAAADPLILSYTFIGTMGRGELTLGNGIVVDVTDAAFVASGVTTGERQCQPGWCVPQWPLWHATTRYDFGALGSFTTNHGADFFEFTATADGAGIAGVALRNDYPGIIEYDGFRANIPVVAGDVNNPPDIGPVVPLSTFGPFGFGDSRGMVNDAGQALLFYNQDVTINSVRHYHVVDITSVSVEKVPEPASGVLAVLGLAMASARRWRRRG